MVNEGPWNTSSIMLTDEEIPLSFKICVLQGVYGPGAGNDYSGSLGARISSVFVILVVSTLFTIFPLLAQRFNCLKIPFYGYLFARHFGTGVIIATAWVHLMDPAYQEIGPNSCVGMTGNWAKYSWPPALMLIAIVLIFLVDICSQAVVKRKYGYRRGLDHHHADKIEEAIITERTIVSHPFDVEGFSSENLSFNGKKLSGEKLHGLDIAETSKPTTEMQAEFSFNSQISAFLILEFGIVFHSVMIGINLGALGAEFKTLYIVLVFHQSFEGLGIGARLSGIPIPENKPKWLPWLCCIAYGFVTPISIAIGLGVKSIYFSNSFAANIIQGVLDSLSAGILMYTGLLELIARDFIFNPAATDDLQRLAFLIISVLLGAGIMSLLGEWA
ncbi:uncharacterized protein PRCAT00005049001 [Priceomyces carsonii]|uniref:uncharacterized protein n=1 Tax=Priceomyces carsonii TaxID=28549 RepID=UPI002ED953F3|nr:unnamed protein product [Priceomyces carsonii]